MHFGGILSNRKDGAWNVGGADNRTDAQKEAITLLGGYSLKFKIERYVCQQGAADNPIKRLSMSEDQAEIDREDYVELVLLGRILVIYHTFARM